MKLSLPLSAWTLAVAGSFQAAAFVPTAKTAGKSWQLASSTLEAPTAVENEPATNGSAANVAAVMASEQALGLAENEKFQCDESVKMWQDFQASGFASSQENFDQMHQVASRFASMGPEAAQFFAKHVGRSSYFLANALLGSTAFQLHERLVRRGGTDDDMVPGVLPMDISTDAGTRLVLEALLSYEQDYQWIRRGVYRDPWDMTLTNRQANPLNLVSASSRFVREAIGTLGRRATGTEADKKVKYFGESAVSGSDFYPEYYQNAFHFQTDGKLIDC